MNGKTQTVSIYNIPDSICNMLTSDDLEMVKLGSVWVEQNIPQRSWQDVMGLTKNFFWSQVRYESGKPEIYIIDMSLYDDIWMRRHRQVGTCYKILTGRGGMQMIQNAFKNQSK